MKKTFLNIFFFISIFVLTLVNIQNCFYEVEQNIEFGEQFSSIKNLNNKAILEESHSSQLAFFQRKFFTKLPNFLNNTIKQFSIITTGKLYVVDQFKIELNLDVPDIIFPFHFFW